MGTVVASEQQACAEDKTPPTAWWSGVGGATLELKEHVLPRYQPQYAEGSHTSLIIGVWCCCVKWRRFKKKKMNTI